MQVHVFRTDIRNERRVRHISPLFNNHPVVTEWSVDLEDCDYVLRLVSSKPINEGKIIYMINTCGYRCEPLND